MMDSVGLSQPPTRRAGHGSLTGIIQGWSSIESVQFAQSHHNVGLTQVYTGFTLIAKVQWASGRRCVFAMIVRWWTPSQNRVPVHPFPAAERGRREEWEIQGRDCP